MDAERHYFRCIKCLYVFAIDGNVRGINFHCPCCKGGALDYMGRVQQADVVREHVKSACDDRCTHARGPICDCHCGGPNHGTGRVIRYQVVEGRVEYIEDARQRQDMDETLDQLREFEHMLEQVNRAAQEKYLVVNEKKWKSWLQGAEWTLYLEGQTVSKTVRTAKANKTHHARMKNLRKAMERIQRPIVTPTQGTVQTVLV